MFIKDFKNYYFFKYIIVIILKIKFIELFSLYLNINNTDTKFYLF